MSLDYHVLKLNKIRRGCRTPLVKQDNLSERGPVALFGNTTAIETRGPTFIQQ